jgi:hypothetical protein
MTGESFELPFGLTKRRKDFGAVPPEIPDTDSGKLEEIVILLRQLVSPPPIPESERTLFYDVSATNATAVTTVPEANSALYTREQIWEHLQRNGKIVNLYNDGPGPWYIRISHDGEQFSGEFPIYEGEAKTVKNVYEIRHRSPHADMDYRITEFEMWKQKNVDFRAGPQYLFNGTVAIGAGNANPTLAYVGATLHNFNATLTTNATTGYIKNRDPLNTLYIWRSQDGITFTPLGLGIGVEYGSIDPNGAVNIDYYNIHSIRVSSDTAIAPVDYEIWVG